MKVKTRFSVYFVCLILLAICFVRFYLNDIDEHQHGPILLSVTDEHQHGPTLLPVTVNRLDKLTHMTKNVYSKNNTRFRLPDIDRHERESKLLSQSEKNKTVEDKENKHVDITTEKRKTLVDKTAINNKSKHHIITVVPILKMANMLDRRRSLTISWHNLPNYLHDDQMTKWISQCQDPCQYSKSRNSHILIFDGDNLQGRPPERLNPNQVWVYHNVESPPISASKNWRHSSWTNKFNRTMSYRLDSDSYAPYGFYVKRSQTLTKDLKAVMKDKTKVAFILASHCGIPSKREDYVALLRKYIPVDFYGRCGNFTCKGNCLPALRKQYKFYLAFENTFCKDYATEKFYRGEALDDVITIARGGANYSELSPEKNYIDTSDFNSVEALGKYLKYLHDNDSVYEKYLERKLKYDVSSQDMSSDNVQILKMCTLCKKAHAWSGERKEYNDIKHWYEDGMCYDPTDLK